MLGTATCIIRRPKPTYIHIHEDVKRLQENAKRLECERPKDINNITLTVFIAKYMAFRYG